MRTNVGPEWLFGKTVGALINKRPADACRGWPGRAASDLMGWPEKVNQEDVTEVKGCFGGDVLERLGLKA